MKIRLFRFLALGAAISLNAFADETTILDTLHQASLKQACDVVIGNKTFDANMQSRTFEQVLNKDGAFYSSTTALVEEIKTSFVKYSPTPLFELGMSGQRLKAAISDLEKTRVALNKERYDLAQTRNRLLSSSESNPNKQDILNKTEARLDKIIDEADELAANVEKFQELLTAVKHEFSLRVDTLRQAIFTATISRGGYLNDLLSFDDENFSMRACGKSFPVPHYPKSSNQGGVCLNVDFTQDPAQAYSYQLVMHSWNPEKGDNDDVVANLGSESLANASKNPDVTAAIKKYFLEARLNEAPSYCNAYIGHKPSAKEGDLAAPKAISSPGGGIAKPTDAGPEKKPIF